VTVIIIILLCNYVHSTHRRRRISFVLRDLCHTWRSSTNTTPLLAGLAFVDTMARSVSCELL